jgi:hypothetical protein
MIKNLINQITFKQVTVVRGLLFSLYLVFLVNHDILLESYSALYLYLGLFAIRVLFNYNLEGYKYSLSPIFEITFSSLGYGDDFLEELMFSGLEEGTREYAWKTSSFYYWTNFFSNLLSTFLSGSIIAVALFYHLAYLLDLLKGLDINMVTTILVGSLLASIIYILFSSGNKVKREEIKGELAGKTVKEKEGY